MVCWLAPGWFPGLFFYANLNHKLVSVHCNSERETPRQIFTRFVKNNSYANNLIFKQWSSMQSNWTAE
jgi:hypothetical protein